MAMILLAAFLITARTDDDTRAITAEFLRRLEEAGFSRTETAERLKALRRRLV